MSYPWIQDSQYLSSTLAAGIPSSAVGTPSSAAPTPVTGYLAVTSPNGLYLTDGIHPATVITPTSVTSTTFNGTFTGTATDATNVTITDANNTNATFYPVFVSNNTGNLPLKVDKTIGPLSYNPSTGTLVSLVYYAGAPASTVLSQLQNTGLQVVNAGSNTTTVNSNQIICSQVSGGFQTTITPTNVTATTFTGALSGNATTATRATNIAGGLGGQIPYQTAVNTTTLLANGTAGQYLKSNGTTLAPSWDNPTASTIDITDTGENNFDYLFTFVSAGGASQTLRADITPDPFTFNPSDGSIKKTTSNAASNPTISISPINTSLLPSIAECKMTFYGGGAGEPRIIGLAQIDDYNSSNFDLGSSNEGDFNIYRLSNPGGAGPFGNEYAGITTFNNRDTGTATAVMYYRQTSGPAKRTAIRVYHDTIQMFSGTSLNATTNIADFKSSLITLIPPVSFTEQLTLPDTLTTATFASGTLTADFGSVSTGIFTGTLTANMTAISFSNPRVGGQYVIYLTATGGTWRIAVSLSGARTNYTTSISVATTTTALLTITWDGTRYLIAGSAYN